MNTTRKLPSKNILKYAGAWEKMPEIELDNFLKEVQTRRKAKLYHYFLRKEYE